MKKFIAFATCFVLLFGSLTLITSAEQANNDFSLSSVDFVNQIKVGWNLGNTLEATGRWSGGWRDDYTPNDVETGWGNPKTTQDMFDIYAEQGFNGVRIPVSWYRWVDDDNGYKIDERWMNRVKEVVGYAYKNNAYVILDMHHDDKDWLNIGAGKDEWAKIMEKYCAIWTQIANEFKDYDEHLIFEGSNEMVNGNDWWGQDEDFARINDVHKHFVETVRATGGNNTKRYLLLPTLGAQVYEHQWGALEIPNNDNHCIIDIHWYAFQTDTEKYEQTMSLIYKKLVPQGTAVIFGECGVDRKQSDENKTLWAKAYFGTLKKYKIPAFIWDDGGNFTVLIRKTLRWESRALVNAISEAVDSIPNPVLLGDANEDGRVNMKDVLIMRKHISGYKVTIKRRAADVTGDNKINSLDVFKLRRYLAGRIKSLEY